jgi:dienelactone hydrolase
LLAAGVNVLRFELPYHGRRRPAPAEGHQPPRNFLSGDLLHVVQALEQAIADTRALVSWLRQEGITQIGLWGISLGGWLGGVLACVERQLTAAVLMTPVVRLDRTIAEALFCAPLRRSLNGARPDVSVLNLVTHRPQLSPDRILVVACEHDLFAPIATIEELQAAWNQPLTWRLAHGHISVLFSAPVMRRTAAWLRQAVNG